MYLAIVTLTMVFLPTVSILIEHVFNPADFFVFLIGRWFVFWAVGVRLGLAGLRQFFQPAFTAKEIFHMTGDEALPVVRELGAANVATAAVGLLSVVFSSFTVPVAISAAIFYGVAGAMHSAERNRSRNENIAMLSDIFLFAVLAMFLIAVAVALKARPAISLPMFASGSPTLAAACGGGSTQSLFQLVGHLGDAGLAASLFLRSAIGGAAEADAADRFLAELDRNTTLERNDLR